MLDIHEIASILQAECVGPSLPYPVERLITDSRKSYKLNSGIFIAIKGSNHNGHHFIEQMYKRGLKAFLVETEPEEMHEDAYYIKCSSSLRAIQRIAQYKRERLSYPFLAITGSNGKTVVKEWLNQLLSSQMQISRSPRSYNSQLGVPLSIWGFEENKDLGIVETGISKPGEMRELEQIIQPEFGLITNIGEAHAANFASREEKLLEKIQLFKDSNVIFFCADHDLIGETIKNSYPSKNLVSWSAKEKAFVQLLSQEKQSSFLVLSVLHEETRYELKLPFKDAASVENLMHCFTIAAYLELDLKEFCKRASQLTEISMRSQILRGINNNLIINDSYSSDLHSLSNAIEILGSQSAYPKKTLILSELNDSKLPNELLYTEIADMMKAHKISAFIGIGPQLLEFKAAFKNLDSKYFNSTEEFLDSFSSSDYKNEAILIKGARSFNLERVAKLLEEKSHSAEMEIRLSGIKHNLEIYRSLIAPETKIMAMVKAFGYGTGDYEVALKLQQSGVDYLAVAFTDEGISLRKRGISAPILVLNPERGNFESLVKYKLEPEVYSLKMLRDLKTFLMSTHMKEELSFPIHLNIDTGMHRLGFELDEIDLLKEELQHTSIFEVKSIFTHLSSADDRSADDFTRTQIELYSKAFDEVASVLKDLPLKHALNTAGVESFPEFHFDMIRVGIGLYGISGSEQIQKRMESVVSLKARILQVKAIKKGEPIGYSRAQFADHDMKIATVSLGYADGLRRVLSLGKASLFLRGHACPIVGNICMDMCMIALPDFDPEIGEQVVLFENNNQIKDLALKMESIPYELLSAISSRVKRVYTEE